MEDFETRERERKMLDEVWGTYQIELAEKLRKMRRWMVIKSWIISVIVSVFIIFILTGIGII